ncbi:hypothetical protein CYY_000323 [Polysphondylium violaceum]|uniref:lysozyme n=1 Tax=Polysphondylium violaceum TaxID=133409 RepID=A0A8J4Q4X7_9MYCE|nr:hypothetical protein CYY_000323 [Polysphondylium violaceum]
MKLLLLIAFVVACAGIASATIGVDISSASDISAFQCLKSNGYDFAIIRAWESVGQPDPNGPHSIYNARDAGIQYVDAYMFPCPSCGNGYGQVQSLVNYLKGYNANYGMIWLDIEGPGLYWGSNQAANQAFFNDLVSGAEAMGVHLGVYTSASQWEPIMGNFDGGAKFPLWYAHYDNNPSFSDFSPFGGWNTPAIKQYNGNLDVCGLGVDVNWY